MTTGLPHAAITTTTAAAGVGVAPGAAVVALFGIGAAAGVVLVLTGGRRDTPGPTRPARWWPGRGAGDQRWLRRGAAAVAAGLGAGLVTGWVAAGLLAGLTALAWPRVLGRDPARRARVARIEAIAAWTEMLRDTLGAAAGLQQAVLATADLAPPAIRPEITELAAQLGAGQRLPAGLRGLTERLADPTADLVLTALLHAAEHRARHLAELLGSLAHAAREQAGMRLRIEAGRARTRTSVRVVVGTTLGFAAAVILLDRPYLAAYDTPTGQLLLLAIGALFAAGFAGLGRIAALPDPPRLLTPPPAAPHPAPGQKSPAADPADPSGHGMVSPPGRRRA